MKRLVFLLFAGMVCFGATAQTVTYAMLQCSRDDAKKLRNLNPDAYLAADGHVYKIGDTLILGAPSTKHTTIYANTAGVAVAADGTNYQSIVSDASIAAAALAGVVTYMADRRGEFLIIKDFKVKPPRKNSVNSAYINVKGNVRGVGSVTVYDLDNSIAIGEIQSQGMTKEAAISRLKEAKEQLDLEIISREEYNALKEELMPYIR